MSIIKHFCVLVTTCIFLIRPVVLVENKSENDTQDTVQAQVVLTVSESKRLIGKAVSRAEIIKKAMKDGMIIICKGTTNTYIAEEITGEEIEHGSYVYGRTYPEKSGEKLDPKETIKEIILVNGRKTNLGLDEAVTKLKAGDVVIKGANALNYEEKTAAVITGGAGGGTTGKFLTHVIARKINLLIPVGLEKQIADDIVEITNKVREPMESLNTVYSMFLLTGYIFTEIEAIKTFADVSVFQVAAGGIGGAEGSVRLVMRGNRAEIKKALKIIKSVQGEPPFVN